MSEGEALVTIDAYPALVPANNVRELLRVNLGGEDLTPFSLDRVKMPQGRTTAWTVPSLTGDEIVKTLEGIIVYLRPGRQYYEEEFGVSGGNNPPDCSSDDAITGTVFGACETCRFSQWGSKGDAQACRLKKYVFLLRQGSILPLVLEISPASLRNLNQYLLRLTNQGLAYWSVVTRFALELGTNKRGQEFARAVPQLIGRLSPEDAAVTQRLVADMGHYFAKTKLEPEEDKPPF